MPAIDVVVVGLGAMGSAAVHHLACRGRRVVGIERFRPGHAYGSSHGATRIIRLGYYEHPAYVPLLRRAYALWRELEAQAGRPLMQTTGIAEIGPARGTLEAGAAIVAAGPWVKKLLPDLAAPLRVTRQVMAWFAPRDARLFAPEKFPVFMIESARGIHYGFPLDATGVKFAKHHHADETVDPDACDRSATADDEALIRPALAECLPAANGRLLQAKVCLYTMTPDGDFLLDRLPGAPQIVVASPCSGHGFKFAPVLGEILADLATGGATSHDISRFRLARFA